MLTETSTTVCCLQCMKRILESIHQLCLTKLIKSPKIIIFVANIVSDIVYQKYVHLCENTFLYFSRITIFQDPINIFD